MSCAISTKNSWKDKGTVPQEAANPKVENFSISVSVVIPCSCGFYNMRSALKQLLARTTDGVEMERVET